MRWRSYEGRDGIGGGVSNGESRGAMRWRGYEGRDGIGGGVSNGESRGVVAMNKRDVAHVILLSRPARLPVDGGHGAAFEFLLRVGDRDEPFLACGFCRLLR